MAKHRPRRMARRPRLESLEARQLLAAFVVNSTDDSATPPPGTTTLRYALSNLTAGGPNSITFNLPAGSVISPGTGLPTITAPVTIDATGGGTAPTIDLDGTSAGASANGLTVASTGVVIKGLAIGNFTGSGISIGGPGGDSIGRSYIGTDITGKIAAPNGGAGVSISGSSNNSIGGPGVGLNVISGNGAAGVSISGAGTPATGNVVAGDLIGVDSTGTKALPNRYGIALTAASNTLIKSSVLSGNTQGGVVLNGGSNNVLQSNNIGLDNTGEAPVPNGGFGVQVSGETGDRIGVTGLTNVNLISGNAGPGIDVRGTTNTTVANTMVGLDKAGSAALPNSGDGIVVEASSVGTTIGGATPDLGTFISGNGGDGVDVVTGSTGTSILTSHIGSDITGLIGVPNVQNGIHFNMTSGRVILDSILDNGQSGVLLQGGSGSVLQSNYIGDVVSGAHGNGLNGVFIYGSDNNTIGSIGAGNVISANGQYGVAIEAGSKNNHVASNYVGLNGSGGGGRGNANGIAVFDSTGTTIGGSNAGAGNTIGTNTQFGVDIDGTGATGTAGTSGTLIIGNAIGTSTDGTGSLANSTGILLNSASGVTIRQNLISGNSVDGIYVLGGSGSTIQGNKIGSDVTGTKQLGNGADGVDISGASNITVGGTTASARNLISANHGYGVEIHDAGATGNVVVGDWIGVDITGLSALGNGQAGVFILNQPGNTIGGSPSAYNVIGFNSQAGILIAGTGTAAVPTEIVNNYVGVGADGVTAAPNTIDGIFVNGAPGVDIAYNVVSENAAYGVHIIGAASGTTIRGNLIGTDFTGMLARGNGQAGVLLDGASNAVVGGTAGASTRNLISGNGSHGVMIFGAAATNNLVAGNFIGTDATGQGALGNRANGVLLQGPNNVIGGTGGALNVISGNGLAGVYFLGGGTNDVVSGNWIGLDSTGSRALGNSYYGVFVDGTGAGSVANNTIGFSAFGSGNIIAGSGVVNVNIAGVGATGTLVKGNYIGTDASGTVGLFPTPYGIAINASAGNVIGGTNPGRGNLIAGSASVGVTIVGGAGASNNLVVGNLIGRGQSSSATLANNLGVLINNSPNNTVGGSASGAANTIIGNTSNPIQVVGSGATGNQTSGNVIGS